MRKVDWCDAASGVEHPEIKQLKCWYLIACEIYFVFRHTCVLSDYVFEDADKYSFTKWCVLLNTCYMKIYMFHLPMRNSLQIIWLRWLVSIKPESNEEMKYFE